MYNFIFYFIYRSQIHQKDGGPFVARLFGSWIVVLALLTQVGLVYSILRFILFNFYSNSISFSSGETYSGKLIFWLPFLIVLNIGVYKYYSLARINKLVTHYEKIEKFYSLFHILKFFIFIFLPLAISIWLVNHSLPS